MTHIHDYALSLPGEKLDPAEHIPQFHSLKNCAVSVDRRATLNTWTKWAESCEEGLHSKSIVTTLLLGKLLQTDNVYFLERALKLLSARTSDTSYELGYVLNRIALLSEACYCQKIKFIFDIYDADADGGLSKEELHTALSHIVKYNGLAISHQQLKCLTKTLLDATNPRTEVCFTFDELSLFVQHSPRILEKIQKQAERSFSPPPISSEKKKSKYQNAQLPYLLSWNYFSHHLLEGFWTGAYVILFVLCFLWGSLWAEYKEREISNPECRSYFVGAKGFGKNLNLQCMLSVLLMCRRTGTLLQRTRFGRFLPINMAAYAHKVVGYVTGICILGHWILHMLHFRCLSESPSYFRNNETLSDLLFTTKAGIGWIPGGVVPLLGWPLLCCYVVMFVTSLAVVRRTSHYEVFFFAHLLYIPLLLILLVHSSHFYMFLVVPGLIYLVEKLSMVHWIRDRCYTKFVITEVVLWKNGALLLTLNLPNSFTYKAGDYISVNVPCVSWYEWHPFSVSSCPENSGSMTIHVRALGEWTKKLHSYFESRANSDATNITYADVQSSPLKRTVSSCTSLHQRPLSMLASKQKSMVGIPVNNLLVPILVDGPFGSKSCAVFGAEHAVLICAGIGITPFASMILSIIQKHRAEKYECSECTQHCNKTPKTLKSFHKLKKVHLIWAVPNQRTLEWFTEFLQQVDTAQMFETEMSEMLDIHIYITGAKHLGKLESFPLTLALDLFYDKHKRDMITGTKSRARFGRPKWEKVFKSIQKSNSGRVSVFYCGTQELASELRSQCTAFKFEFHKESY